jgi:hypothetical protein
MEPLKQSIVTVFLLECNTKKALSHEKVLRTALNKIWQNIVDDLPICMRQIRINISLTLRFLM